MRIAMVGKRGNKLELFNRQAGTSYPHNDTFNKMPDGQMPAAALSLADGSSLVGLRRARSRAQARAACSSEPDADAG